VWEKERERERDCVCVCVSIQQSKFSKVMYKSKSFTYDIKVIQKAVASSTFMNVGIDIDIAGPIFKSNMCMHEWISCVYDVKAIQQPTAFSTLVYMHMHIHIAKAISKRLMFLCKCNSYQNQSSFSNVIYLYI